MSETWIVPDEGKALMLDELFRLTTSRETFSLRQWVSGGPVDDDSTLADFTIASYTGYANITIARGDFSAASVTSHVGEIVKTTNPVFTCTGGSPQTIAGLLLVGTTSGKIYMGCNYGTAIVMSPGATDTINPMKIQDKTFV